MAAAVVQLTSCAKDKFISPVPTNAISDLTAFDSKDRIEGQVRAIYASIKNAVIADCPADSRRDYDSSSDSSDRSADG